MSLISGYSGKAPPDAFKDMSHHLQKPRSLSCNTGHKSISDLWGLFNHSFISFNIDLYHCILEKKTTPKMITGSVSSRLWDHVGTRSSHTEQSNISREYYYETFKPPLSARISLSPFIAGEDKQRRNSCYTIM